LAQAYEQALAADTVIELAPVPNSYRDWIEALKAWAVSPPLAAQVEDLRRLTAAATAADWRQRLTPANQTAGLGNRSLRWQLEAEWTERLVGAAGRAFNTDPGDLITAAVGLAIRQLSGVERLSLEVETHGRHDFGAELELDRTVGWFTALHPVVLELAGELAEVIVGVKEALRRTPGGPVAYQLAASQPDWAIAPAVPAVAVNYLGQVVSPTGGALRLSDWPTGRAVSARNQLENVYVVNTSVVDQSLTVDVWFDPAWLPVATAEQLNQATAEQLRRLIDFCCGQVEQLRTASDFTASDLAGSEVDEIAGWLEQL
jgi:non-ribosomal peptide synthase protein (TIGR01720 family)